MSAHTSYAERLLFDRLEPQGEWVRDAACASVDSAIFFPASDNGARLAKKVCAGCPARIPCGEWAIRTREPHGVWGGLTEQERAMLRRAS